MATFNKFDSFITEVAAGTHAACLNADTDVIKVYLTNAAPSTSADSVKADLVEIDMTNCDVASGGGDVQNAATQTTNTITVVGTDVVFTATGALGPFKYAVIYNDTAASDELIAWWEYPAAALTLANTETFTVDFGASMFTLG